MDFYRLTLGVLAVWRLTHLLNAEDGPGDVLVRFRRKVGNGFWGSLLDCFYCLSLYLAAPFAIAIGADWRERLLLWPAVFCWRDSRRRSPRRERRITRTLSIRSTPMSCCGQKRTHLQPFATSTSPSTAIRSTRARAFSGPTIAVQYVGTTSFAVIGPVSGIRYSFAASGARLEIDARDRRLLATIPGLRELGRRSVG
jgi:hypothetical protein